jgi:hypothetical protein
MGGGTVLAFFLEWETFDVGVSYWLLIQNTFRPCQDRSSSFELRKAKIGSRTVRVNSLGRGD